MENKYTRIPQSKEPEINLSDVILLYKQNFIWVIISILVCSLMAIIYIYRTPESYLRNATVLIKDEEKGGGDILSAASAFSDMGFGTSSSSVENEIHLFKSKRLMQEVVKKLELNYSYKHREGLKMLEYYKFSPIDAKICNIDPDNSYSFEIEIVDNKKLILSNFRNKKDKKIGHKITTNLNDTTLTPFGKIIFLPTVFFSEDVYDTNILFNKSSLQKTTDYLLKNIEISMADKNSSVINLSMKDESIARAEDILNTLIDVHNDDNISDKNKILISTNSFIKGRIQVMKKELSNIDTEIEKYMKTNKLTDVSSETKLFMESVGQLSTEDLIVQNQLSLANYMKEYIKDPKNIHGLIPANAGIENKGIQSQIEEYNTSMLKRNELLSNSGPNNPIVSNMNNSLFSMRNTIINSMNNLIAGLKLQIKNMEYKKSETSDKIKSMPTQQKYIESIKRQQKIKEELYLYLLQKSEENDMQRAITESNCRIIDFAYGPVKPVAPKSKIILLGAFIFGLVLPFGFNSISKLLNNTVKTRKELEDLTNIPFLGEIPYIDNIKENNLVIDKTSRNSINESFRILRSNLSFMLNDNKKVVTSTSFSPDSGKSFVFSNLAKAFALTNKKIILIDLDIRKATLSSTKKIKNNKKIGVTNYLSGNVSNIDEIIYKTDKEGFFDMVNSGSIPPNPVELLLSPKLDEMIEKLKDRYDLIFIDCVPFEVVADMSIVNRISDIVVYITKPNVIDKRYLPRLEKLHDEKKLNNMCFILNGVNIKHSNYGYGYKYSEETIESNTLFGRLKKLIKRKRMVK